MKKTILISVIILIGISFIFWAVYIKYFNRNDSLHQKKTATIKLNKNEPVLAHFSFNSSFQNKLIGSFSHFRVILNDKRKMNIKNDLIAGIDDSIPVMITVETWNSMSFDNFNSNPLEKIVNGHYDDVIELICKELIKDRLNVFIRFNPDMEVPVNRYPWQYYGGTEYIEAFRYFSTICKTYSPQVKIVWGPAGYPGTMEYYPGDDVVDAATITLKSDSEQSLDVYPKDYTIQYDLFRRLHRLRFIDKPIFILGSKQINDSDINSLLLSRITNLINEDRNIIYSDRNYIRPQQKEQHIETKNIIIGLHDPHALLVNESAVKVEHLFVAFDNLRGGGFEKDFQEVIERNHDVIVTFEPFHLPDGEIDSCIIQHLTQGKYNDDLDYLFSIILSTKKRVYLRYAQEMEIPITRYAWQSQNPLDYIHSFRYFMTYIKPWPHNIKRVWGPAGDRGSIEWYPGDDVVDFNSIAIYGLPDINITDPKKQESFSTIFNRKNWRLRFIEKPLFITEFGVKGEEEYQIRWLEEAAKVINKNPHVVGINYFNMTDIPKVWGEIKPPDWSISKATFYRFVEILEGNS